MQQLNIFKLIILNVVFLLHVLLPSLKDYLGEEIAMTTTLRAMNPVFAENLK